MAEKIYPHMHFRDLGEASKEFRAQSGGSDRRVPRIENRQAHAASLRSELELATSDLKKYEDAQEQVDVPKKLRGMPITIESRPDIPLTLGDTRATTRGFSLLTVRRGYRKNLENDGPRDQATFFVTSSTLDTLRDNLTDYAEWTERSGKNRPNRFFLFESCFALRSASIRDFWGEDVELFPKEKGKEYEWEVWTRRGYEDAFERELLNLNLQRNGKPSNFIETIVFNLVATLEDVQRIVRTTAAVVELRSASSFTSEFMSKTPESRKIVINDIADRIESAPSHAPRVTILDSGVYRSHPFLAGSLPGKRRYSVEPEWKTTDHDGHGTRMAGVALFGDLSAVVDRPNRITLTTSLESVVVTAPNGMPAVPARDALESAVELVEQEANPRIFCLAQTARGEAETGRPTSTSAILDKLAFGDGLNTRLFCAAVGNAPHSASEPYQVADYDDNRNFRFGIQSPAQAANALSIGAVSLIDKPLRVGELVAPVGDLAPTSRTAQSWQRPHLYKPDIVMEGGNFIVDPDEVFSRPSPHHMVLTTSRSSTNPLARSGETSTATAMASGLAARLLASYPSFRMETVRGLMVHAAEWTDAMEAQAVKLILEGASKTDAWASIIDRYGWGVPNETNLFRSASNALTLIAEDELEPYEKGSSGLRLKQMKYFKLPWPTEILRSLNATKVEMRCTLSYFIEPDLHAGARDRLDRYASHRLKFDVKRYNESDENAQSRVNELASDDGSDDITQDDGWLVGHKRQYGSLHHDIWQGPAYQLAERDGISIVPVRGWWGEINKTENVDRPARFSLIVSIRTPEQSGDLVAETRTKVRVKSQVATVKN